MLQFLHSLLNLVIALWDVVASLVTLILPWFPLLAWVAFWLLAVNWQKLFPILLRGGLIGVFFMYFLMIMIWGLIAPPEGGTHHLLGLQIGNFVGKTVYVTALFVIAGICASVQMSGAVAALTSFKDEEPEDDHAHGHGHGDHGHGDHGHAVAHAH